MRTPITLPRPTIRRMLLAVAASAVLLSAAARLTGPRPGVYLSAGGCSAGGCRDDADGVWTYANGDLGGHTYQAGVWRTRSGILAAGLEWKDGRLTARAGSGYLILW